MGIRIQVSIPNKAEIIGRLKGVKNASQQEMEAAVTEIFEESIEIFKEYPATVPGNHPPPPYYKRKLGMTWDGSTAIPGKKSEDLTASWAFNVSANDSGVIGRIGSRASYSGYVHGSPTHDPPQAPFHKGRWPVAIDTIEERITAETPIIRRMMDRIKNIFNRG